MSESLLPCPFCGRVPTVNESGFAASISCGNEACPATLVVASSDLPDATRLWNARSVAPRVDASALIAAAERYMMSVKALGQQSGYNKLTYFEAPIIKMPTPEMQAEAHNRWMELNNAGKALTVACEAQRSAATSAEPVAWPKDPPATGDAYVAGRWSRRNYEAMIEDFEAAGAAPTTSPEPDAVREALKFYADLQSYRATHNNYTAPIIRDEGRKARDALSRPAHGGWEADALKALKPFAEAARNFTCTIGPDGIDDGVTIACQLHGRQEREAILTSADFSFAAAVVARNDRVTSQPGSGEQS